MHGITDHDRSGSRQVTFLSKRHGYNPKSFHISAHTGHTRSTPTLARSSRDDLQVSNPIDPRTSRPPSSTLDRG